MMATFTLLKGEYINLDKVEMITPTTRHPEEVDLEVTFESGNKVTVSGEEARILLREVAKYLTTPEENTGTLGFKR
jgi:hypothetical protein